MVYARKGNGAVLAGLLLFGFLALPTHAQEKISSDAAGKTGDGWHISIAPYAWLVGISGDVTVHGRTAHTSTPFNDILKNLDFGGLMQIEAWKGNWGFFLQPNFLKLTPTSSFSSPTNADIAQGGPAVREAHARLDSQTLMVEFGGFYSVARWGTANKQGYGSFDVLAGGRYWYQQAHVFLNLPNRGFNIDDTAYVSIIDPILGFRILSYLAPKLFVRLRGDAGGFGVSSNTSHFSWNAVGLLGYDISPKATVAAGYRYLYINYSGTGSSGVKLDFQGPVMGFEYTF